jgi:acetyl-CoA acetyltransferase
LCLARGFSPGFTDAVPASERELLNRKNMPAIPKNFVSVYRALRTPFSPVGSNHLRSRPEELLAKLANAMLDPLGIKEVESWLVACPFPEGSQGWNIARAAAHLANKESSGAAVVSSLANSGLDAFLSSVGRLALTGGASLVSAVDLGSRVSYGGATPDAALSYELLQRHAFWPRHMAAHTFTEQSGIKRNELDAYASQRKPGRCPLLMGLPIEQDNAAAPLPESASEFLSNPPIITENGGAPLFTNAHVAPLADGASSLLLARGGALDLRPLASIRGVGSAAINGKRAPEALVTACQRALQRAEVSAQSIERVYLDDSFAGVALGVVRRLGLDSTRLNSSGSSLRCGFSAGADGLRLIAEASLSLSMGEGKLALVGGWSEGGAASAVILESA